MLHGSDLPTFVARMADYSATHPYLTRSADFAVDNAIRTSHNPVSPAFVAACDKLGVMLMEEAFDCW